MGFIETLGIDIIENHADGVSIECLVRKEFFNFRGVVHGGLTASVADSAMGIAVSRHYGPDTPVTTVEMKINYLRPVAAGKLVARSRIVRDGKRICVGQVDVRDGDDNLVAIALTTFAVLKPAS
tara:strand:+ start:1543 stop:1914 length:372 start_codon:yes stop_codon:yes gene_type:complete